VGVAGIGIDRGQGPDRRPGGVLRDRVCGQGNVGWGLVAGVLNDNLDLVERRVGEIEAVESTVAGPRVEEGEISLKRSGASDGGRDDETKRVVPIAAFVGVRGPDILGGTVDNDVITISGDNAVAAGATVQGVVAVAA
jgi:hypothetical protein